MIRREKRDAADDLINTTMAAWRMRKVPGRFARVARRWCKQLVHRHCVRQHIRKTDEPHARRSTSIREK
ncbi:hypothetical protein [Xanthomonas phaseoli]|uniref:Uncharacterized protein n=1 Tax=Xanthomonas manihotis TaxID=43353 RepID=A0A8I1XQ22_XANMN|nr:hypothetical protein [Xanthomonas phaseoli]KUF21112.1 hypothetical protein AO826_15460 [Xanthomonas phaseoli pv. manihotis]MBO9720785.1 hypothetical protein [Xanthomonas phaseoli pv. manihotis]MBO9754783.1 hypothetical protein [Xanthomonas phaseoli pv. manihotis]MBO9761600.1 hypothetical protein [Xanthomonas phaseoli pv. manihotis]MBO9763984.1 hypothetical protein [Xanthomonas phaseoli pv. manihotis]